MIQNPYAILTGSQSEVKKEVIKPPDTRRIFLAAIWGAVVLPVSFFIWFVVRFLIFEFVPYALLPEFFGFLYGVFLLVFMGVTIGFYEWVSLSSWIPSKRKWLLLSTLTFILLFISGFALLNAASIQHLERVTALHQLIRPYAENELYKLDMIIGAAVGIPFGLVFGVSQSFALTSGKRRWWLASVIIWTIVWAVLGLLNVMFAKIFD